MRRLVAIVLMLFLPLQWSWAAAAGVCDHEAAGSHFGHHAHQHDASADGSDHGRAGEAHESGGKSAGKGAANGGYHADCHTCHFSVACIGTLASDRHLWPADAPASPGNGFVPEPPVEALFRPPLVAAVS